MVSGVLHDGGCAPVSDSASDSEFKVWVLRTSSALWRSFNFNFKLTFKATDASTTQQTLFSDEGDRVIRQLTSRVSATAANLNDRHQRLCVIRDRP